MHEKRGTLVLTTKGSFSDRNVNIRANNENFIHVLFVSILDVHEVTTQFFGNREAKLHILKLNIFSYNSLHSLHFSSIELFIVIISNFIVICKENY